MLLLLLRLVHPLHATAAAAAAAADAADAHDAIGSTSVSSFESAAGKGQVAAEAPSPILEQLEQDTETQWSILVPLVLEMWCWPTVLAHLVQHAYVQDLVAAVLVMDQLVVVASDPGTAA